MVSQSSSLPVATGSRPCAPPALFISTSTFGVKERIQEVNSSTLEVFETSRKWDCAAGEPSSLHSAAIASIRSERRAPRMSLQPSRAKALAEAAPNPAEAPVIKTHLFSNREAMPIEY